MVDLKSSYFIAIWIMTGGMRFIYCIEDGTRSRWGRGGANGGGRDGKPAARFLKRRCLPVYARRFVAGVGLLEWLGLGMNASFLSILFVGSR